MGDARHEDGLNNNGGEFILCRPCDIPDTPWAEKIVATGRARCRICGQKIIKGDSDVKFLASFDDGGSYNAWRSVTCHAHEGCLADNGLTLVNDSIRYTR